MATAPKTMSQKRNQGRVARRWVRRDPEHDKRYAGPHKRFRAALLNDRTLAAAENNVSLCEDCAGEGKRFSESPPSHLLDLHHVFKAKIHDDKRFDPEHVMFLCRRHHRLRTARGE